MYDSAWFGYIWFEPGNFLVNNRIQGSPPPGSLARRSGGSTQRDALESSCHPERSRRIRNLCAATRTRILRRRLGFAQDDTRG